MIVIAGQEEIKLAGDRVRTGRESVKGRVERPSADQREQARRMGSGSIGHACMIFTKFGSVVSPRIDPQQRIEIVQRRAVDVQQASQGRSPAGASARSRAFLYIPKNAVMSRSKSSGKADCRGPAIAAQLAREPSAW